MLNLCETNKALGVGFCALLEISNFSLWNGRSGHCLFRMIDFMICSLFIFNKLSNIQISFSNGRSLCIELFGDWLLALIFTDIGKLRTPTPVVRNSLHACYHCPYVGFRRRIDSLKLAVCCWTFESKHCSKAN